MTHANPRPTWNDFAPNYGPYLPLSDEQKSYDGIPSGILPSGEEGLLDSRQDRGENLGFGINYPYPYPNLATEAKFAQVYGQSPIVFDNDYWEDSGVLQTLPPNPGTHQVVLTAYDGNGGYARSSVSLSTAKGVGNWPDTFIESAGHPYSKARLG